jgi:carbon storage regulator
MLVLTRRTGQALRIGDGVEVYVVRVDGDRVVLGIQAPRDVSIVRAELVTQVGDEVRDAAGARSRLLGLLKPS